MAVRTAVAAGLLLVEAALALLGVVVHHGLTAEYGDVTDSALQGLVSSFTAGIGPLALGVVAVVALPAVLAAQSQWSERAAFVVPLLMVLAMAAVTPVALRTKLDVQYSSGPRCVSVEDRGPGPGTRAARQSQRALDSIEHVGYFGGGGASGVGGCDRPFVLLSDVDVLQHYRATLPESGWRVVEDDPPRLRAERDGMAFEVVASGRGGQVWAGPRSP